MSSLASWKPEQVCKLCGHSSKYHEYGSGDVPCSECPKGICKKKVQD